MDSGNAARLVWVVGFFQYDDIHNRIRVLIDIPGTWVSFPSMEC